MSPPTNTASDMVTPHGVASNVATSNVAPSNVAASNNGAPRLLFPSPTSRMSFKEMLDTFPIPAATEPGEIYEVKMLGTTYRLQAAPSETSAILTSFGLFNNLPRELKTKIWGYALEPRQICLIEVSRRKSKAELAGEKGATRFSSFKLRGCRYPHIFQVCKEVKELAGAMGYKPVFKIKGSSKSVWFHPSIDILNLNVWGARTDFCNPIALSELLTNPRDLQSIRYVRFPIHTFDGAHHLSLKLFEDLSGLQVLYLAGAVQILSRTLPQFTLKLDYEDMGIDGVRPVCNIPGNKLVGHAAMAAVHTYISGPTSEAYFLRLYKLFANSMRGPSTVPSSIKLELTYSFAS